MERKSDFIHKQSLKNHKNYEAPTCTELKKMLRQKNSFQWSKEDELVVLENLFQFSCKNNVNYYTPEFYHCVNTRLRVQLSENQLSYILYCLRKQYLDHCTEQQKPPKEDEDQKDLDDSHCLKVLELSRKIWKVNTNNEGWPKTKVLRDNYEEALKVYVVEELGFGVGCLSASVVEEIRKDWEDFKFVEDEFRMMQNRFSLQLCELKTKMNSMHTT